MGCYPHGNDPLLLCDTFVVALLCMSVIMENVETKCAPHTVALYCTCLGSLTLNRTQTLNKALLRRSFTIYTHRSYPTSVQEDLTPPRSRTSNPSKIDIGHGMTFNTRLCFPTIPWDFSLFSPTFLLSPYNVLRRCLLCLCV